MRRLDHVRRAYHAIAFCCVLCGLIGMALSIVFMASAAVGDVTAGAAGFVSGAVLIGSGLIAIALLLRTDVPDLPAE